MKSFSILAVIAMFLTLNAPANAQLAGLEWVKTYGGVFDDYGRATASLSGGDVVSVGNFFSTIQRDERSANDGSAMLFRHSPDGQLMWQAGSGLSNHDRYSEVLVTSNDRVVVVGKTQNERALFSDALVQCFSEDGELLWSEVFGGRNHDSAICVTELTNGDIVVGVRSYVGSSGSESTADIAIHHFSAEGASLDVLQYRGAHQDFIRKFVPTDDGGYVALIDSRSTSSVIPTTMGNFDVYLVKFAPMHSIDWVCRIGGTDKDASHDVIPSRYGGYVVVGQTTSTDGDFEGRKSTHDQDAFVAHVDEMGYLTWLTAYGSAQKERANAILELPFGGYVVGGYSMERTHPFGWEGSERTINVVHITGSGTVQKVFLFGGSGADNCIDIAFDAIGDVYMTGWTTSHDGSFRDVVVEDVDFFIAKFGLISQRLITDVEVTGDMTLCNLSDSELIRSYYSQESNSAGFTFRAFTLDGKPADNSSASALQPIIIQISHAEGCKRTIKIIE